MTDRETRAAREAVGACGECGTYGGCHVPDCPRYRSPRVPRPRPSADSGRVGESDDPRVQIHFHEARAEAATPDPSFPRSVGVRAHSPFGQFLRAIQERERARRVHLVAESERIVTYHPEQVREALEHVTEALEDLSGAVRELSKLIGVSP